MKRLAAILIILSSLVILASCSAGSDVGIFDSALKREPSSANITTSIDSAVGVLDASYTVTYTGGVASVDYTKEQVKEITPDTSSSDELVSTLSGSASVDSRGNVTEGDVGALVAAVIARTLKLDVDMMTYTVDGSVLSANISAENTEYILGVYVGYDAAMTVTLDGEAVKSILITYTADAGACRLFCEFN